MLKASGRKLVFLGSHQSRKRGQKPSSARFLTWSKQKSNQKLADEQRVRGKESLLKAASTYELEAKIYDSSNEIFLAERVRSNKEWCESLATDYQSESNLSSFQQR
jgi:hypothetical protein